LWGFCNCPDLVHDLQVVGFGTIRPGSIKSSSKRSYSSTQHSSSSQFFKTSCKPKCSLWVFSNFPKLVRDLQVVATCFLIGFGTIQPGFMKCSTKREILFIDPK
jgi:hypothetical protein